jgi:predicted nucleic acid-binding protein
VTRSRLLVIDANVLIDFRAADPDVLALVAKHLGVVHVPRAVIDEVPDLTPAECRRLGLAVVTPETTQLLEASGRRGRLSFADHVCLVLARDGDWACITNDRALRDACAQESIETVWGLELMLNLVGKRQLPSGRAIAIARRIHEANPRHVTQVVLTEFIRLARRRR